VGESETQARLRIVFTPDSPTKRGTRTHVVATDTVMLAHSFTLTSLWVHQLGRDSHDYGEYPEYEKEDGTNEVPVLVVLGWAPEGGPLK
jgi:hypothetical protein